MKMLTAATGILQERVRFAHTVVIRMDVVIMHKDECWGRRDRCLLEQQLNYACIDLLAIRNLTLDREILIETTGEAKSPSSHVLLNTPRCSRGRSILRPKLESR